MKRQKKAGAVFYTLRYAADIRCLPALLIPLCTIAVTEVPVIAAYCSAESLNILQSAVTGSGSGADAPSLFRKAVLFAAAVFLAELAGWVISSVSELLETWWKNRVEIRMQKQRMRRTFVGDLEEFDCPERIDRRSAAWNIHPVEILKTYFSLAGELVLAVSFSAVLFGYHPVLIPIAFLAKFPLYFFSVRLKERNRKFEVESNRLLRKKDYFYHLPIERASAKEFRLYHMEEYTCNRFSGVTSKYLQAYQKKYTYERLISGIEDNYDTILLVITEILIGAAVFHGRMPFGTFTLLLAAFTNVAGSAQKLTEQFAECRNIRQRCRMFRDYMEESSLYGDAETHRLTVQDAPHTIEFCDVSFAYPGTDRNILDHFSMKIEGGQNCAMVGLNGSGKSTMVSLLLRLYHPDSGEILLDGQNIDAIRSDSYYQSIACVFQNVTKYAMSVKDYVCAGQTEQPDEQRIRSALEQVQLREWCEELPQGLDTQLTRMFSLDETASVEPSVGQWQKLSIARAIYKDAPIIILDEPSASLDVEMEHEIFRCISQLAGGKTTIMISHRLSNVQDCDKIFLAADGRIAEEGTHQELLERGGAYAEMFRSQAKYYAG